MENITFNSKEHEKFYEEMLERIQLAQVYHRALFYCLGACKDTRDHVEALFDFETGGIRPDNMHQAFQTGASYKVTRMAFNLWNGYIEEGEENQTTPSALYDCGYGNEFNQAIRLRYPEYYREQVPRVESIIEKLIVGTKATSGQVGHKSNHHKEGKGGER